MARRPHPARSTPRPSSRCPGRKFRSATLLNKAPSLIRVAYVHRAVGLRGEVEVESLTDDDARIRAGLALRAGARTVTVAAVRQTPRGLVLRFAGVRDRDSAEQLRGEYLEVDAAGVADLPEGSYYHWQLIGLEVVDPQGHRLGRLVDVQPYPANDVYVLDLNGHEALVPAVREIVLAIDVSAGRMVVDLPPEEEVR